MFKSILAVLSVIVSVSSTTPTTDYDILIFQKHDDSIQYQKMYCNGTGTNQDPNHEFEIQLEANYAHLGTDRSTWIFKNGSVTDGNNSTDDKMHGTCLVSHDENYQNWTNKCPLTLNGQWRNVGDNDWNVVDSQVLLQNKTSLYSSIVNFLKLNNYYMHWVYEDAPQLWMTPNTTWNNSCYVNYSQQYEIIPYVSSEKTKGCLNVTGVNFVLYDLDALNLTAMDGKVTKGRLNISQGRQSNRIDEHYFYDLVETQEFDIHILAYYDIVLQVQNATTIDLIQSATHVDGAAGFHATLEVLNDTNAWQYVAHEHLMLHELDKNADESYAYTVNSVYYSYGVTGWLWADVENCAALHPDTPSDSANILTFAITLLLTLLALI